ncbi:hypothetical protein [Thiospirillum jenense]|nr:hypothetical protein [Thiospirillum jenense]
MKWWGKVAIIAKNNAHLTTKQPALSYHDGRAGDVGHTRQLK